MGKATCHTCSYLSLPPVTDFPPIAVSNHGRHTGCGRKHQCSTSWWYSCQPNLLGKFHQSLMAWLQGQPYLTTKSTFTESSSLATNPTLYILPFLLSFTKLPCHASMTSMLIRFHSWHFHASLEHIVIKIHSFQITFSISYIKVYCNALSFSSKLTRSLYLDQIDSCSLPYLGFNPYISFTWAW